LPQFLLTIRRLKEQQRRQAEQTRKARQRTRARLRKLRSQS
jgi:hypothetical protein